MEYIPFVPGDPDPMLYAHREGSPYTLFKVISTYMVTHDVPEIIELCEARLEDLAVSRDIIWGEC